MKKEACHKCGVEKLILIKHRNGFKMCLSCNYYYLKKKKKRGRKKWKE